MNDSPPNIDSIARWLETQGLSSDRIEPLTGDVSARLYYRVFINGRSSIVAKYPSTLADTLRRFLATTILLENAKVPVPKVIAADSSAGIVWLEDLGPNSLYDYRDLSWSELQVLLLQALAIRRTILSLDRAEVGRLNPILDGPWLERELEPVFRLLLLPLGLVQPGDEAIEFRAFTNRLCGALGRSPQAPCHRDFMARNLLLKEGRLVVIDHQDLRIGPAAYDLASLLNDSIYPPQEVEEELLASALSGEDEKRHYNMAVVQRTLKAAGTFVAFAERGQSRYLALVPATIERMLSHLAQLEEGKPWWERFSSTWPALLENQLSQQRF